MLLLAHLLLSAAGLLGTPRKLWHQPHRVHVTSRVLPQIALDASLLPSGAPIRASAQAAVLLPRKTPSLSISALADRLSEGSEPSSLLSKAAGHQDGLGGKNYYRLLKALGKRKAWTACVATVEHIRQTAPAKLNSRHVTAAIVACGAGGQSALPAVLRLVELMFASIDLRQNTTSLAPDLISLNAAIAACADARAPHEALRLLHEALPRAGILPDSFSYSAALNALSRTGDANGALDLFCAMSTRAAAGSGVPVDAYAYAPTISALNRAGRADEALALFGSMGGVHHAPEGTTHKWRLLLERVACVDPPPAPDAVCCGAALHACNLLVRQGTMGGLQARERFLAVWATMEAHHIPISTTCINEAIASCGYAAAELSRSAQAPLTGERPQEQEQEQQRRANAEASGSGRTRSSRRVARHWARREQRRRERQLASLHADVLDLYRSLRGRGGPSIDACTYNAALDVFHGTATGDGIFSDALDAQAFGHRLLRKSKRSWTLDLHGLSAGAARQAVIWWLREVQQPLLQAVREKSVHDEKMSEDAWRKHDAALQAASLQLCIIVGKGKHREARWWQQHDRAVEDASDSVRTAVTALLADAQVPLLPTQGDSGTIAICPTWDRGAGAEATSTSPPPAHQPS